MQQKSGMTIVTKTKQQNKIKSEMPPPSSLLGGSFLLQKWEKDQLIRLVANSAISADEIVSDVSLFGELSLYQLGYNYQA